jgi:hypothetical protein
MGYKSEGRIRQVLEEMLNDQNTKGDSVASAEGGGDSLQ